MFDQNINKLNKHDLYIYSSPSGLAGPNIYIKTHNYNNSIYIYYITKKFKI